MRAVTIEPAVLVRRAEEYLVLVREEAQQNPLVNVRLATALCDKFSLILVEWEQLPLVARPWLAGAIYYFSAENDDEPDFSSPTGFEDDVEVFNACIRLAQRDELPYVPISIETLCPNRLV